MQGKPLLVVVIGMPGSGKTTLATAIAQEIRCPLVSRDAIKEGTLRTLGMDLAADRDVTSQVYEAFFGNIQLLLNANTSLVAEAAFQHKAWYAKLEPLQEVADIRIILCAIPPQLANTRQLLRAKEDPLFAQYHPASPNHDQMNQSFEVLRMDVPMLSIDTTIEPDLAAIATFLKR